MIEFRKGDLLKQEDVKVIAHQVNCQGKMNSGIAKQIRETYPDNFDNYKNYCLIHNYNGDELGGTVLFTKEYDGKIIVNMFGQGNYGYDGKQYTHYGWIKQCIDELYAYTKTNDISTVGIPYKIGCVRGGADWSKVYRMIEYRFKCDEDINLVICEFDRG